MSVTLQPPGETPAMAVDIDAGVIEEARRRQRRRRTLGTLPVAGLLIATGIALLSGGGGAGRSALPGELRSGRPLKVALIHGRAFIGGEPMLMGVTPSLQGGNVGVCVTVSGSGSCNGPPPTTSDPVYGGEGGFSPEEKVGPAGEIDALFTGPQVTAVRVAHLGTFKAHTDPGLPPGAKEIVFYRPPGSRGTVLAPGLSPSMLQGFEHGRQGPALTETLLGADGRPIRIGKTSTFTLPNSYWQSPQPPPADGRCAMSSTLPGAHLEWGQVATKIAGDPTITTPAWLTCLHIWFGYKGTSYETAVLLDGKSPGTAPASLWGAIPVPGHTGIVQVPSVQREIHVRPMTSAQAERILAVDTKASGRKKAEQILHESERTTFTQVLVPPTVARRVGAAWLIVRNGPSLDQRIAFLEGLHVTKLDLLRRR